MRTQKAGFAFVESPAVSKRKAFGFTLVELLVVIGIIAILMSVLLPSLSRARESAKRVQCLSNLKQISTAFFMYTEENKGWFPMPAVFGGSTATDLGFGPATYAGGSFYQGYPSDYVGWPEDWIVWRNKQSSDPLRGAIVRYLGNPSSGAIMTCPSDDNTYRAISGYPYSYAMNAYLSFGTNQNPHVPPAGIKNNLVYKDVDAAWKITQVKHSADTIIVYEEDERAMRDGRGQLQSPAVGTNANNIIGMLSIRHDSKRIQPDNVPDPISRQGIETNVNCQRFGNVGFVDGHAEYVNRLFAHDRAHYDPKFP